LSLLAPLLARQETRLLVLPGQKRTRLPIEPPIGISDGHRSASCALE